MAALLAWACLCAPAFLPAQTLNQRQTRDLNLLLIGDSLSYLTDHTVRCFENSMAFHKRLFDYTPSQPVTILLEDWEDFGNAGTNTVPLNYIKVAAEPFDYVFDTCPANERINWLMHHELTHVVVTDKANARDQGFRKFFGGKVEPIQASPLTIGYSFLTAPRWYAPRWYEEGIAVTLETWMSGGSGRVLGGYDEMVFRTRVLEHAKFFSPLAVETVGKNIDFNGGQNSYLYGTRFLTYLSIRYGPDRVIAWYKRTDDSAASYTTRFREVFGLSLDEGWQQWIAFEEGWQAKNLALIRQYPVTPQTPIATGPLGSVSRTYYDAGRNRIYAALVRQATVPQIVAIDPDTGGMRTLTKVKGPAYYFVCSLAYDPKGDKLFFTTRNSGNWRDLNELDLKTGRTRLLLPRARTGDLVVHPRDQALWGIMHRGGHSHLVRIPKPYDQVEPVLTLDYGKELVDIDLSPDGLTLSATQIEVTGGSRLVRINVEDLLAGRGGSETLHTFGNNPPNNFVFTPDGRYLLGSSYYTGTSNLWRYDLQAGKMEALTNAETGLFRPLPLADGKLVAYRYTAMGFEPVRVQAAPLEDLNAIHYLGQEVVLQHPEVKTWNAGSPARIDLDQVVTHAGVTDAWAQTRLVSFYPVVEGYKKVGAVGMRANFTDPMAFTQLDGTATYSPNRDLKASERFHLKVDVMHEPWKVVLKDNASDFYDLFGPTKVSRKGQSASVSYHGYLIANKPEYLDYTFTGTGYRSIDTLPDDQNVSTPFTAMATMGAHMDYKSVEKTMGAVEPERGVQWTLAEDASRAQGLTFPRWHATLAVGELVPGLEHSSLWLRTAVGAATGDPANPLSGFYFGGFGNNWVDHQEINRYREYTSMPGLPLDGAGARNFGKATLEWTLPPIRLEKAGAAGLYLDYLRFALFQNYLATNLTGPLARTGIPGTGLQADCALKLFSNMNATLSFGVAQVHYLGRTDREGMVSLKLLDY